MIQKIKAMILTLALGVGLLAPVAVPAVAFAADTNNNINQGLCKGVTDATGSSAGGCFGTDTNGEGTLQKIAKQIINIFSIIVGIIAVIMIIYGGFRYITSGGASDKVGNAKNTLIYAIVGLIVVALAQFIVHFVLTSATQNV